MSDLISIESDISLARDISTNAIVNTNSSEYNKYLLMRKQKEAEHQSINQMQTEIECLKSDLCEIKNLLLAFSSDVKKP